MLVPLETESENAYFKTIEFFSRRPAHGRDPGMRKVVPSSGCQDDIRGDTGEEVFQKGACHAKEQGSVK